MYLQLAINTPLYRTFEYKLSFDLKIEGVNLIGCRALVKFGNRKTVGIVIEQSEKQTYTGKGAVKEIEEILDDSPIFDEYNIQLLKWAASYYHYPIGEVFYTAMPLLLRKPKKAGLKPIDLWTFVSDADTSCISRAKACKAALNIIREAPCTSHKLKELGINQAIITKLFNLGLITKSNLRDEVHEWDKNNISITDAKILNDEQQHAYDVISASHGFNAFVINGVTGSGKTEIYLQLIAKTLKQGKQALVLVPEINLTPQTVKRFYDRFNVPIVCIHSSLNDNERFESFAMMKRNEAAILIGTRSALFANIPNLGIIIIDEEHDSSYRQGDGFRYHARDCAVMLAFIRQIPIIMGTATPSIETVNNIQKKKYTEIILSKRAGNASDAIFNIIDMRRQIINHGISKELSLHINEELGKGNQVLLLINRRGYSQKLICHNCGYVFMCKNCDSNLTYHMTENRLVCHHCETKFIIPHQCPECGFTELTPTGNGTEQIFEHIQQLFPNSNPVRIDRDAINRKGVLNTILDDINNNKYNIIIGTQMLAKGHHFPNVTLVGIIDIDSCLFSNNYRAHEQLAQLIVQVAGRSGRGEKQGYVYLQTHTPDHPVLSTLLNYGYHTFAEECLKKRKQMMLPPFTNYAILKADGTEREKVISFIYDAYNFMNSQSSKFSNLVIMKPTSAYITRKQNRYHFYVLINSRAKRDLSEFVDLIIANIDRFQCKSSVHSVIEIDPLGNE